MGPFDQADSHASGQAFRDRLWRAGQGDHDAAAELVQQYEPEIRRFIRFRLTDPKLRRLLDSVDVSQSVLARFFVGLTTRQIEVQDPRQLMKLLTVMAHNRLLDHIRQQKTARRGGKEGQAHQYEIEEIAGSSADPAEIVSRKDLYSALRAELNGDDCRLLDERLMGREWSDIARESGASAEALRKRLSRALDAAARKLGMLDTETE